MGLSLTKEISRYYGIPLDEGVLVTRVVEGSPAHEAGIVTGDIILALDYVPVKRIEKLLGEIHKRRAGEKVNLTVYRDGFEYSIAVILAKAP